MHPELLGCWIEINNELIGNVDGEPLLPSMKGLRRHLFRSARRVGLTPVREPTFRTNSQNADFFTRNQTAVIGELWTIAVPIP